MLRCMSGSAPLSKDVFSSIWSSPMPASSDYVDPMYVPIDYVSMYVHGCVAIHTHIYIYIHIFICICVCVHKKLILKTLPISQFCYYFTRISMWN